MNEEVQFNPQVISDFFGMINAKNIFSYTNYDFESECDTSYMKFSDVGEYTHPYNNAYSSNMVFNYAAKVSPYRKRKSSVDLISIFRNRTDWNRIGFVANNIINDCMSYYGRVRNNYIE